MSEPQETERSRVLDGELRRHPVTKWLFLPFRWLYKVWFVLVFFGSLVILYLSLIHI